MRRRKKTQTPAAEPFINPAFAVLADLKKNLGPAPPPPRPKAVAPPPPPVDEEGLFQAEMADVLPLPRKGGRRPPAAPPPEAWLVPSLPNEDLEVLRGLADLVGGRAEFDLRHDDEYLEGRTKGLPPVLMEQLRAGRIPFQAHLDLHGLTITRSEAAVTRFILDSAAQGLRCVLIIHGRGLGSPDGVPALKRHLETFLLRGPARKYILAFTTARPIDGGLGASYVLLRG